MKLILALFFIVACKAIVAPPELTTPVVTEPVVIQSTVMPEIVLPQKSSSEMAKASELYKKYGNTQEFYNYLLANIKPLQGGNYTDVNEAIKDFRHCLSTRGNIPVVWHNYGVWPLYKSAAIGGWVGTAMWQNPKKDLDAIERAGHWYHETSHACGFSHVSNDISKMPIIKLSWPYQAGYLFISFLKTKQ